MNQGIIVTPSRTLERPEIREEVSDKDCRRFEAGWQSYKAGCQLSVKVAGIEQYNCCKKDLYK